MREAMAAVMITGRRRIHVRISVRGLQHRSRHGISRDEPVVVVPRPRLAGNEDAQQEQVYDLKLHHGDMLAQKDRMGITGQFDNSIC